MSCDHTVGVLHDLVVQSEISELLKNESEGWNSHAKTMMSLGSKSYRSDHKPLDFIDRRRGFMVIFNNCPYCGEEIDWKTIKSKLKGGRDES